MKVSLRWLQRYIPLDRTPEAIEEALTMLGFEVEGIERQGLPSLPDVVVGEVLSSQPHPSADRLSVCEVRTGREENSRTIVCGAKNYRVGDRVAVALPGAVLPGNFTILSAPKRGIVSHGMMCSARELGMGEEHDGILILDQRPAIGTPINQVFTDNDVVFDLEITPNRPDCLSHAGLARELAARFSLPLSFPEVKTDVAGPFRERHSPLLEGVVVETPTNCPHYRAYSIRGVKIGPSPQWLRTALEGIGLRSINNVVDATNFVLYELGQPLHAFDAKKLAGSRLIVRPARPHESFTTLDGKERLLDPHMTVIADAEKAVALAGVMGGLYSEVDDSTVDVVLEAAYFNAPNVRRTSRRLGLSTDASYRFERGVDPCGTSYAALRCIDLILATAGGELSGPPQVAGQEPLVKREIRLRPSFVSNTLGFPVPSNEIVRIWSALQLTVEEEEPLGEEPIWTVSIPSFRLDLERSVDLVEEFLRVYGTDHIPAAQVQTPGLLAEDDPLANWVRRVANFLRENGFDECVHYTLRSRDECLRFFGPVAAQCLVLENPLASDQSHLRPCLVPGLLDALKLNQNRRNDPRRLCETGRIFSENNGKVWEWVGVGFLLAVKPQRQSWLERPAPDFHRTASFVNELLRLGGVPAEELTARPLNGCEAWQDGHAATIGGHEKGFIAQFGLVNLAMARTWEIDGLAYAGVVRFLPEYLAKVSSRHRYQPYSHFPDTSKDLALSVPESIPAARVRDDLEAAAKAATGQALALEAVELFDLYRGAGLPEGAKSLAFNLRFRGHDRTLTDDEVNRVFADIQKRVASIGPYSIRS